VPIEFEMPDADSPLSGYCDREDIELIYGASNVAKWADLENNEDSAEITAKIQWACDTATSRMDDRLRDGPYAVPFEEPYPQQIVEQTARLAGVLLYDARGIVDQGGDGEPIHQLAPHRRMVQAFIMDVLSGRIKFSSVEHVIDYPQALHLDSLDD
jgi:hypothetical protein